MQINKAAVLHMYCTYEINSYPLSLSGLTLRMPLMAKSSLCPQPRWDSSFPSPFVLLLYFECSKLIWLICVLDPSTEMCRLQTVSGWFRPQILPGRSWWCCEHYFFLFFLNTWSCLDTITTAVSLLIGRLKKKNIQWFTSVSQI